MRGLVASASAMALLASAPAFAQDSATPPPAVPTGDMPPPQPTEEPPGQPGHDTYTPADFARFAPRSALDMLNQVPGFSIRSDNQQRGLGEATGNVLVNGQRLTSKSDSIFDQLARIAANRVEKIEIVDGASLGIPGLSGQVANVTTKPTTISGRFDYRMVFRPKYAKPNFVNGEVSVSGSGDRLEWTVALSDGSGRGAAGGPSYIYDGLGTLTENRDVLIQFWGDTPRVAGRIKWKGPGSTILNANASYSQTYQNSLNDEDRDLVTGLDNLRDTQGRTRGHNYEIGGDIDFALGPGRLKLIGLDRAGHSNFRSDLNFIYADQSPTTGSRYTSLADTGEQVARAEYRWKMLGGDWQIDGEAAFNQLDQVAHLYSLTSTGSYSEIPFPGSSGGVTEDRYESILTHNRTIGKGLTVQLGVGGEYSKLSQTGPGGLVREFWRPKGSLTLAWTPHTGLDLSLKLARTVGQLNFGDFLASVALASGNANAGNVQLVPPQAWELDLKLKQNLKAWGSVELTGYGRWIQDYIGIIPVGTAESSGNIDSATLYGVRLQATINLDPLGWRGAKINANGFLEGSNLRDPLTGIDRPVGQAWTNGEISLRYDIPKSNWALGGGADWTYVDPYVRLFEVGRNYEGPIYTFAFIENKNVFGLTVNLNVFNLTGGKAIFERTVWNGLRDRSTIAFVEARHLSVQPIFRFNVKGNF
jgi:hypothetical protein